MPISISEFTFDEAESRVIALAVTAFAALLAAADANHERKSKKLRHVERKLQVLNSVGLSCTQAPAASHIRAELTRQVHGWTEGKRNALLIDIAFCEPYSPYQLEVAERDKKEQLGVLCTDIGLSAMRAEQVLAAIAGARKAHRNISWGRVAAGAVLGAIVLAAGGYVAAPLLAAQLGAAAGLSGAAAVSHGLALLGGGSLAAGGAGVAGGMSLVVGCTGALGGVGAAGATALWNAGYAAALGELVKLQVSYKEVLLRTQLRGYQATEVIEELIKQRDQLKRRLDEERELNDKDSERVTSLIRIDKGYADAISWMRQQVPDESMSLANRRLEASAAATEVGPPVDHVLDPEIARRLEQRFVGSFSRDARLDGIDVVAIGVVGAIGAAIDMLLVTIPSDVNYLSRYPQSGSIMTKFLKNWTVPSENAAARHAKVPFDQHNERRRVPGMFPGNHRFLTPGHDPILGLVVGVFDILRGGRTAIGTDGVWRFDDGLSEPASNVAAALVLEVLHLISDVATKAGLPAPLMTAAGLLRFGSFGERERTVADLARYMYLEGYDLRHFLTTCSTPMAMRLLLGGYFLGRKRADRTYEEHCLASARRGGSNLQHPQLQTMTFLADSIACAANVRKIAIYQGNPSAFNYGQWLALVRSGSQFLLNQAESPTEVLLDRANANEQLLRRRWEELSNPLGGGDLPDPGNAF